MTNIRLFPMKIRGQANILTVTDYISALPVLQALLQNCFQRGFFLCCKHTDQCISVRIVLCIVVQMMPAPAQKNKKSFFCRHAADVPFPTLNAKIVHAPSAFQCICRAMIFTLRTSFLSHLFISLPSESWITGRFPSPGQHAYASSQ